jgi:hypothetical protein
VTRDAQYTQARLVALYDRMNGADHDHAFYESRLGPAPQQVLDHGSAIRSPVSIRRRA